jgi:hypothetical protein
MAIKVICDLCNKERNAEDMIACSKCVEAYEKKIKELEYKNKIHWLEELRNESR